MAPNTDGVPPRAVPKLVDAYQSKPPYMNVSGIRHKASSSPTSFLLYLSNMMNAPMTTPTDDEKTITPPHNAVEVCGPGASEDALIEQYGAQRVRRLLLKVGV